jgi:hypothetical protein
LVADRSKRISSAQKSLSEGVRGLAFDVQKLQVELLKGADAAELMDFISVAHDMEATDAQIELLVRRIGPLISAFRRLKAELQFKADLKDLEARVSIAQREFELGSKAAALEEFRLLAKERGKPISDDELRNLDLQLGAMEKIEAQVVLINGGGIDLLRTMQLLRAESVEISNTALFKEGFQFEAERLASDLLDPLQLSVNAANSISGALQQGFSSFTDSVVDNFREIDEAWRQLGINMVKNFAKAAFDIANQLIRGVILSAISEIAGQSLFSQLGGGFRFGPFGSAKGNVFQGGNVVPFQQGGVINQFARFPLAGGNVGTAVETGKPEGILPLDRDRQGRLGVHVSDQRILGGGGGNDSRTFLEINQTNHIQGGGDARGVEEAMKKANRELMTMIDGRFQGQFLNGRARTRIAHAARSRR